MHLGRVRDRRQVRLAERQWSLHRGQRGDVVSVGRVLDRSLHLHPQRRLRARLRVQLGRVLRRQHVLVRHQAEDVLQAVLRVLNEHPEVRGLRVQGHTDNRGSAARNKELSKQRAQTVLDWLVKHGIDASRLTAEGFGPDKPLESNDTEAGRRVNRRVEFHLVQTPQ